MKAYIQPTGITGKLFKYIRANRRFSVFLICLLISIICWIFTSLNKSYQGKFKFRLNYINRPFLKNINGEMPHFIVLEIEARGFDLIAYSFRQKIEEIDVNVGLLTNPMLATRKTVVVPTRNLLSTEITGMQSEMILKHIVPEYLTFDFSPKFRKKVPVIPDVTLSFKKQFYAPLGWIMKPDSIEISGTEDDIRGIHQIFAEPVNLSNIDRKLIIPVPFSKKYTSIEMSPEKTWLYVPVDEIAEEEIQVPIEISNGQQENSILLPDKVTIIYQASIKRIDQVNTDEFRVCVNVGQAGTNGVLLNKVAICHMPPGIYKAWVKQGFVKYLTAR